MCQKEKPGCTLKIKENKEELWLSIVASWQPIIRIYEGLCKFWQLLPAWLCVSAKREKLHCDSGVKCVTNKRKKELL